MATASTAAPPPGAESTEEAAGRALVLAAQTNGGMEPLALQMAINKAELDHQVSTAMAYPRSWAESVRQCVGLATMTTQSAGSCIYSLPRDGKAIVGPSIRLAELVQQAWRNNHAEAWVTEVNRKEGFVSARGSYWDLEANVRTTEEVRRSIKGKGGKLFSDDMIIVTGNAARSIAKRNAIFAGIPRVIWGQAYEKCLAVVRGDEKTLGARRADMLRMFSDLQVEPATVYRLAGVKGELDITMDMMVVLAGMYSALKNGEATMDDLLGRVASATPSGGRTLDSAFGQPAAAGAATAGDVVDQETGEVTEPAKDKPAAETAKPKAEPKPKADKPAADNVVPLDKAKSIAEADAKASEPVVDAESQEPEPDESELEPEREAAIRDAEDVELDTEAFNAYASQVQGAQFFATILDVLNKFKRTPAYTTADRDMQHRAKLVAYNATAALIEANKDTVYPDANLEFFLLWCLQAEPVEVQPMFVKLVRSRAWANATDEAKDAVSAAAEAAGQ